MLLLLQERSIAEKMDRQLTHRSAARSVTALGAMLAHEIKNPLSGIRGAAQLLETSVCDEDRALTRLICEETDRIVKLVDRMESFSDERPVARESLNIHAVLDHVKRLAQAGFARHIRFAEVYDPSLPHVLGSRDQLIQVFLNLDQERRRSHWRRKHRRRDHSHDRLPPGRAAEGRARAPSRSACRSKSACATMARACRPTSPPICSTRSSRSKSSGSGLGLALVAKVIGDHGGIIEFESHPRRTTFRVLMPLAAPRAASGGGVD